MTTNRTERVQARVTPGFRDEIKALAVREKRDEADMVRLLLEEALEHRAAAAQKTSRR